jgi:hypothetical protein
MPGVGPSAVEASPRAGILPEAAFMSDWHRSLRFLAPLVSPTPGTRSYRAIDAASLVKSYVKRQKHDRADAEAICEAVTRACGSCQPRRPNSGLPDASPQIALIISITAHLAEFRIVAPVGGKGSRNCCILLPTRTRAGI